LLETGEALVMASPMAYSGIAKAAILETVIAAIV
jgi:hypothetical protein